MIVVRGCTEDLLKLEVAVKTILHYAKKKALTSTISFLKADLCLFYSILTWKANSHTNLDKLYEEDAKTFPIILCRDIINWDIEIIPILNELLSDKTGKHHLVLTKSAIVTQEQLH